MTVLVIGLGISGRAAVDLLNAQGERVVGYDARAESASGVDADEIDLTIPVFAARTVGRGRADRSGGCGSR